MPSWRTKGRTSKFLEELAEDQDDDWEDVDEVNPDWEDPTLKKLGIKITRGESRGMPAASKMSLTIMMIIKYTLSNRESVAPSAVLIDWGLANKAKTPSMR